VPSIAYCTQELEAHILHLVDKVHDSKAEYARTLPLVHLTEVRRHVATPSKSSLLEQFRPVTLTFTVVRRHPVGLAMGCASSARSRASCVTWCDTWCGALILPFFLANRWPVPIQDSALMWLYRTYKLVHFPPEMEKQGTNPGDGPEPDPSRTKKKGPPPPLQEARSRKA